MKSLSLAAILVLLASVSPAAAQYSYSGSMGALRTAPPQNKDRATAAPSRPMAPTAPNLTGGLNKTGGAGAESQRTGEKPKPPVRFGQPLNNIPGQARPIPGVAR